MSKQRIEIIIQEIDYWKKHQLLPDVYCDFLLALYTKGENEQESLTSGEKKRTGLTTIFQFISQFLLLLLAVIVINLEHATLIFQIIFLILSSVGIIWLFRLLKRNHDIFFHLSMVILLVYFFLLTVFIGSQYISFQQSTNMIMLCNFVCWLFLGRKYRLTYLLIISLLLTIFTLIYTFL